MVRHGYASAVDGTAMALKAGTDMDCGDWGARRARVRKRPSWSRSWANFSLLWLYPYWNAWANLHILGQPNTFLAAVGGKRQTGTELRRAEAAGERMAHICRSLQPAVSLLAATKLKSL